MAAKRSVVSAFLGMSLACVVVTTAIRAFAQDSSTVTGGGPANRDSSLTSIRTIIVRTRGTNNGGNQTHNNPASRRERLLLRAHVDLLLIRGYEASGTEADELPPPLPDYFPLSLSQSPLPREDLGDAWIGYSDE